jgi:hypothetical protein
LPSCSRWTVTYAPSQLTLSVNTVDQCLERLMQQLSVDRVSHKLLVETAISGSLMNPNLSRMGSVGTARKPLVTRMYRLLSRRTD